MSNRIYSPIDGLMAMLDTTVGDICYVNEAAQTVTIKLNNLHKKKTRRMIIMLGNCQGLKFKSYTIEKVSMILFIDNEKIAIPAQDYERILAVLTNIYLYKSGDKESKDAAKDRLTLLFIKELNAYSSSGDLNENIVEKLLSNNIQSVQFVFSLSKFYENNMVRNLANANKLIPQDLPLFYTYDQVLDLYSLIPEREEDEHGLLPHLEDEILETININAPILDELDYETINEDEERFFRAYNNFNNNPKNSKGYGRQYQYSSNRAAGTHIHTIPRMVFQEAKKRVRH